MNFIVINSFFIKNAFGKCVYSDYAFPF